MTETPKLNVDTGIQAGFPQVDNFSKELSDFLLDEKLTNKEQISNLLISDPDLKIGFESFLKTANIRQKIKCKKELQNCSTEEEIKSIIVENFTEGYKIGSSEVGNNTEIKETIVEDENFINLAEQARTDTEQARTDTEQVKIQIDNLGSEKAMRQVIEARDNLVQKYAKQNLDAKTNQNSESYQTIKSQLENNGTLNQLRQSHDEQFINDYILVQATLVELKSNPTSYEQRDISFFDKLVKNLENSCNISDTNLNSFSIENLTQTRTELFHSEVGNDSLIQAKNQNMESHDYSKIFPEMGDKVLIENYEKFLEGDLKDFCQRYQNDPDLKTRIENPTTDEDRILLQNYQTMISELNRIKEETEDETKNLMEELTILSQIKGMSMCIGQENGKDFNLNKAREIQNDNGVLTLNGHIDGVDFSVRHDTNKENARLQTSSKLGISDDKNTFTIGSEGQYVDSPFIMPSQEEIFSVIVNEVQSESNNIKNADNMDSYFENLQKNVMGRMDKVYKEAENARHYITNKVKGEKIVNNSLSLIQSIKPDIRFDEGINKDSNPKLYSFFKIINFNIENSTTGEKDKLNKILNKIGEIKDNYRNSNGIETFDSEKYPPIIENYLKNEIRLNDGDENSKFGLISDLFSYYNKNSRDMRSNSEGNDGTPSKMIINDLYRDLFEFSGGGSEIATVRKNENEQKNDRDDANKLLLGIEDGSLLA